MRLPAHIENGMPNGIPFSYWTYQMHILARNMLAKIKKIGSPTLGDQSKR